MKSVTVSMTGFSSDPREEEYKGMMQRLGVRYSPSLVETASALIVKEATTEKYKIAKVYQRPIPCVSIDWLLQSGKANAILDPQDFAISEIFYGVEAYVVGFSDELGEKIEAAINANGGVAHNVETSRLQVLVRSQEVRLLVAEDKLYGRVRQLVAQAGFAVVGVEWVVDSINARMCKFPYDYALNQCELGRSDTTHHLKKMRAKVEGALEREEWGQEGLLVHTIVCLANVSPQAGRLLRKLVVLQGGFWLQEMSPVVTHVLVEPLQEGEYLSYCVNGALTHVLRIEWLLDTVYFGKRMLETDYAVRSFLKVGAVEEERSVTSAASGQVLSLRNNHDSNKKSISMPSVQLPLVPARNKHKVVSSLFAGKNFYLESSQRCELQLKSLHADIGRNGGRCYNSRRDVEGGLCYYVLKDATACNRLIQKLKSQVRKTDTQVQPVSPRWVLACTGQGRFIDILAADSYVYKPLPFSTPLHNFHRLVFAIAAHDQVLRLRLKELYNVLGSVKNTPNKADVTHCLCADDYAHTAKYRELRQENKSALFVDWKWLIECANSGKIVDANPFLIPPPTEIE